MRRLFIVLFLIPLAGCNGASIATQWKLRGFELGTADLAQWRLALRGPDWATATPESAVIEVKIWTGDDEAGAKTINLRLQKGAHPADREELARQGGAPSLTVIELAPQSLAAARAMQQEAARIRAEGGHTRGKLHIAGALACRHGDIPSGAIPIDIFIHADDGLGWLPLYEDFDMRRDVKDEAKLAEALPPCGKEPKAR